MQKVLEIVLNEVGYLEKSSNKDLDSKTANAGSANYTKYGRDMHNIQPTNMDFPASWCDAFVDWCFMKAYGVDTAKQLLCGNFDDYTVTSAGLYKQSGRWFNNPERGDQVFFKNNERICHTGLVVDVKGGFIFTVEGNTSSGGEIVPNGGAVCAKKYPLNHPRIAGYGRPKYNLVKDSQESSNTENIKFYEVLGWNKDNIGWWYAWGYNKGEYHVNNAVRINGKLYFFDTAGYCVRGDLKIKTDENGALISIAGERFS